MGGNNGTQWVLLEIFDWKYLVDCGVDHNLDNEDSPFMQWLRMFLPQKKMKIKDEEEDEEEEDDQDERTASTVGLPVAWRTMTFGFI